MAYYKAVGTCAMLLRDHVSPVASASTLDGGRAGQQDRAALW